MAEVTTYYCGNGNIRKGKNGTFRSISICLDELPEEFVFKSDKNGKRYIKLNVSDKPELDQYKKDVTVTVDTFKPDPNYKKPENSSQSADNYYDNLPKHEDSPNPSELPF